MGIAQNDVGKPVPGSGRPIRDETKRGMNLVNYKIPSPPGGQFGVGTGSGVLGGGYFGSSSARKRNKK